MFLGIRLDGYKNEDFKRKSIGLVLGSRISTPKSFWVMAVTLSGLVNIPGFRFDGKGTNEETYLFSVSL